VSEEDRIAGLRGDIRRLTEEILYLVAERSKLSEEIGRLKWIMGMPVQDPSVEQELRCLVRDKSVELGLDPMLSLRLLNLLLGESVTVQRGVRAGGEVSIASIIRKARELEASGDHVIHLEVGEPDFPPPRRVVEALKQALDSGLTRYTETVGIAPLREAIAEHLNRRLHLDLKQDQVIVTSGGRLALNLAVAASVKPGGEVLIFEPAYPAYKRLVEHYGGVVVSIPTSLEEGWTPDLERVKDLISGSTDLIIMNYPNNPTGKILDEDVFRGLVELASERGVTVLSDEVYMDYAFKPHRSILSHRDCRSIFVSSFSKSYGMTGFRIGYAISDGEVLKSMAELEGLTLTCIPEFIQHSAIAALECEDELSENVEKVRRRVEYVSKRLRELPLSSYKPDGGLYIFLKAGRPGFQSDRYALNLLQKYKVAVTPGKIFGEGYTNHFRVSLCQPEDILEEALRRIGESLS